MKNAFLATALVTLVAAMLTIGFLPLDSVANDSNEETSAIPGPLDGLVFVGELGPEGKPLDTSDTFVFENGTFVSKECELRCKYPPRPYFVRAGDGRTEFISETKCPYKDAWITWRGTVEGDTVKGRATWVVKRWYWTVENIFVFEGKLAPQATTAVSD